MISTGGDRVIMVGQEEVYDVGKGSGAILEGSKQASGIACLEVLVDSAGQKESGFVSGGSVSSALVSGQSSGALDHDLEFPEGGAVSEGSMKGVVTDVILGVQASDRGLVSASVQSEVSLLCSGPVQASVSEVTLPDGAGSGSVSLAQGVSISGYAVVQASCGEGSSSWLGSGIVLGEAVPTAEKAFVAPGQAGPEEIIFYSSSAKAFFD